MSFQTEPANTVSRRAFLIMPFALAGFFVLLRRPERALPDAAQPGTGPEVELVLFSNDGQRQTMARVKQLNKTDSEWRSELAPEEFAVTRRQATELAFTGRYWRVPHENGIYRCACCGNALFRSKDKFDSGTGWPSFRAPVAAENIETRPDRSLVEPRIEVLCRKCLAHLGHVFDDGPLPTGLRYCLNSAALRFVKAG